MATISRELRFARGVALSIRGIRKTFARGLARSIRRTAALSGVDLELLLGETVVVTGPESSGKTTLLQCAAGLLRADSGEVVWFGERFDGGGLFPGVFYVPAVPVFYPFFTVRDVLAYRAEREVWKWERPGAAVDEALEAVGLTGRAADTVSLLTRAESKRLAIAEALAARPRVILIDTCTVDMAPAISGISCRALASFTSAGGSVLVATRDPSLLLSIASRVVMLADGRVVSAHITRVASAAETDVLPLMPRFVAEKLH
ncbi:MAG TPA: ATP-binding cassette domain-containing protein [Gemmatimonadaceae bacterium]|nr:ATP-binding cassette domain-containing protein [Gemmatimonadaceae bacterium]